MECAKNGMCPLWNVLLLECDQSRMLLAFKIRPSEESEDNDEKGVSLVGN